MSYCRFGWDGSDVYVIATHRGDTYGFQCYCEDDENNFVLTEEAMIAHLAKHRREGKFVPFDAIQELWNDIEGASEPVHPEPAEITNVKQMMNEALSQED